MKKIILILILGISGTIVPMELVKQSLRTWSRMLVSRAIGLGATITPAVIYAEQKGYNYNNVLHNPDVQMDAVSIVAPTLLTALGTRSVVKTIAPRLGKTNLAAMLKGAINYTIADWLFFENKATKKIKALWNKYSYKL